MAQEYQPRRFFRNAPNFLLRRYFAGHNVLSEVDFGALTETQVEPIYEAWLKLSDDVRKEMEQDFQDIDGLATEGGSKAILDEARWHGTAADTIRRGRALYLRASKAHASQQVRRNPTIENRQPANHPPIRAAQRSADRTRPCR